MGLPNDSSISLLRANLKIAERGGFECFLRQFSRANRTENEHFC
jgi:hypothetical protein